MFQRRSLLRFGAAILRHRSIRVGQERSRGLHSRKRHRRLLSRHLSGLQALWLRRVTAYSQRGWHKNCAPLEKGSLLLSLHLVHTNICFRRVLKFGQ